MGDLMQDAASTEDLVVLIDENGSPCGTAPRESVHHGDTPRHLAFSCWLIGPDGRLLLTRRALSKRSWPGVWTNAFCGHPRPGEEAFAAVRRRAADELGIEVSEITPLLPTFSYRAVDSAGVVENEFCPVFTARLVSPEVRAHRDEVCESEWVSVADLRLALRHAPWALSPWIREQGAALDLEDGWGRLA